MKRLHPLFALILGVFLALLAVEGVLRLFGLYEHVNLVYDTSNGLIRYPPGTEYRSQASCYDVRAHINNLGLYGPDITSAKPQGTTRIIIVGSSFVEGIQVPLTERFDTKLEGLLSAQYPHKTFEVVALGFPANGTYLNMLYYKYYMKALAPDVVIDLMSDFDLGKDAAETVSPPRFDQSGHAILSLPQAKQNQTVIFFKGAARESRVFEALYEKYLMLRVAVHTALHPQDLTTQSDDRTNFAATWDIEGKLMRDFKSLVESDGYARFALASWTTAGHDDRDFVSSELRPITAATRIPYLDLTPYLDSQEEKTGRSAILSCGGHWNAEGHTWVAEDLARFLTSSGLIRP